MSWTSGARVACVNCRSQFARVWAVGIRANPQKRDERIAGEIAEMLQPAGADVEQRQHEQGQPPPEVIAAGADTRRAQAARQRALAQVAAEQLQAAFCIWRDGRVATGVSQFLPNRD